MNSNPAEPPDANRRSLIWLAGIVAGDVAVGLQYGVAALMLKQINLSGRLGIPSLFLVPALGGLIASYIWRSLRPSIGLTVLNSIWMTLLAMVLAMIAFHEGAICILILSPLYFLSVLTGVVIGRVIFKADPTRLQVSFLPLLMLVFMAEPFLRSARQSVVRDEMIIRAPPAKVWGEVKAFPPIASRPIFWLFRIGLPYPVATTSAGDFVNARRECIFSHDAIFKERVVEFIPAEKLTFEIVESPPDPELIGHLTPQRGQFLLRSNPDGTTTLVGSTWYTLQVRPLWYFDLWTHHIFRAVHLRVMEDIRRRAESAQ